MQCLECVLYYLLSLQNIVYDEASKQSPDPKHCTTPGLHTPVLKILDLPLVLVFLLKAGKKIASKRKKLKMSFEILTDFLLPSRAIFK